MKKIKIDPSELREKISICKYDTVKNEYFSTEEVFTEILSTFARKVEQTNHRQLVTEQGSSLGFKKIFHFDIRNREGLNIVEGMYILHKGSQYFVLGYTELSSNPPYIRITTDYRSSNIMN